MLPTPTHQASNWECTSIATNVQFTMYNVEWSGAILNFEFW